MSAASNSLTCPKCAGQMRNYERNGVHVDQCNDCRGIFLDRGELERLIDAESAHYERELSQQRDEPRHEDRGRREHHDKPRKSKKRSFLENMLESFGE